MSQAEKHINVKAVRVVLTETKVTLQNMTTNPCFTQAEQTKPKNYGTDNNRGRYFTQKEPLRSGRGSLWHNQAGFSVQTISDKRKSEGGNSIFPHSFCIQCGKTL